MKQVLKKLLTIGISALIILGVLAWLSFRGGPVAENVIGGVRLLEESPKAIDLVASKSREQTATRILQPPERPYEGLSDPRWEWWKEMERKDLKFQFKMAVDFHGKFVDQDDEPVEGAAVSMTWTDLSATGTSKETALTDRNGLFGLTGRRGKSLGVDSIRKDGYYMARGGVRFSFEYAAFFDQRYHHPDPNNPVIFRLQKKGTPEPLIVREQERPAAAGQTASFPIGEGATVGVELLAKGRLGDKEWRARISVPGGGIQVTDEEFPFLAPESGYQPSLVVDHETPKPPAWVELYEGGVFFVRTPQGFGRVELKMIAGKDWMRLTSHLNPSESRNLECPAKGSSRQGVSPEWR
ncbi:MAG: carboxypeptidase regulatory-like domain-containing protein [Verrucomicrobiae bacterium]|nr:carboxypeptidase regulatory-like domain-containing protein [Verrucomicrobiae bacterium]